MRRTIYESFMDTKTDASKQQEPISQESFSAMRDRISELEAQLLAEREKLADRHKLCVHYETLYKQLREQLAAERDKVQPLVKALQEIANGSEASADSLRRYAANEIARLNQNTGLDWIGRGDQ